jgi:hypothetical protein
MFLGDCVVVGLGVVVAVGAPPVDFFPEDCAPDVLAVAPLFDVDPIAPLVVPDWLPVFPCASWTAELTA